jgi:hypothetical protein
MGIAEAECREYPRAFYCRLDMMREVTERTGACRQCSERVRNVAFEGFAIDATLPDDAVQVAVWRLKKLVQPVHEFDVRVAAQLAKGGCGFDAPIKRSPKFAE